MDATAATTRPRTRGVLFVHSSSRAICPHVEWAVAEVLGSRATLEWTPQGVAPGSMRAELPWTGLPGTGARLASALRGFTTVRFEVTEDPNAESEGERFAYTPSLGIFRATIGMAGDIMIHEDRLRHAISTALAHGEPVEDEIAMLLGEPWDAELEPFRRVGDSAVRWLHQVV